MDIQAAVAQRAGVGRYAKALAEHLGRQADGDEVRLFFADFRRRGLSFPTPGASRRTVVWCPGRVLEQCWKRLKWPPYDRVAGSADVYHFPNFLVPPLARGRAVATIHDVGFLRHPEHAEDRNLRYLRAGIGPTLRRAEAIITVSRFSAREIEDCFPAAAGRIHAIPLGVDLAPPEPMESVRCLRERHGLSRPYLLTVGTVEPRKNLAFFTEVFERLRSFDGDWVVAGQIGWKHEPILARWAASPLADRIRHLTGVADDDLPALYAGAELFVFPSLYEGFGLPPLEAMACGTAVVASDRGALPEVLSDAARLVSGFDAAMWADVVEELLQSPGQRAALAARGRARAALFTWEETARRHWVVYRKVAA